MVQIDLNNSIEDIVYELLSYNSVSQNEDELISIIYNSVNILSNVECKRINNSVHIRTTKTYPNNINLCLLGHIDTVPINNHKILITDNKVIGRGAVDMKSSVAVILKTIYLISMEQIKPIYNMSFIIYDCEEIEYKFNGLNHIDIDYIDIAIIMEPTNLNIELGCQGSIVGDLTINGDVLHVARSFLGINSLHKTSNVIMNIINKIPIRQDIYHTDDFSITYRSSFNFVKINGGIATNVLPEFIIVTFNYRFTPFEGLDLSLNLLDKAFNPYSYKILNKIDGSIPLAGKYKRFIVKFKEKNNLTINSKLGWTDVSRFAAKDITAFNFGIGDPNLAHSMNEYVYIEDLYKCIDIIENLLTDKFE